MEKLAEHILFIANKNNKPLKRLHLQFIICCVITQAFLKELRNIHQLSELYDQPFVNWEIGPTIPSIFYKYELGAYNIIQHKGTQYAEFNDLNELIKDYIFVMEPNLFLKSYQKSPLAQLPINTEIALAFLINH